MKHPAPKAKIAGIGATFLLAVAAQATPILIDDFSEPSRNITSRGQQEWVDTTATVPGGVRDGSVGCESSDTDGNTTMRINNGLFAILTNKKAAPSVYLSYDATAGWGSDKDYAPFNGAFVSTIDLTGGGKNDRFSILFAYANGMDPTVDYFNDVFVSVQINGSFYQYDAAAAANTWMDQHYETLNAGTACAFEVLFSALGSGIDMTQVEAIHLHVCSENRDMEYGLDQIVAIPEPAAAGLILLAGGGLFLLERRFGMHAS